MPKYRVHIRSGFLKHRPLSDYCCYGNHTGGSKPIKKIFNVVN